MGKRRKLRTIYKLFTRNILSFRHDKFSLFIINLLLLIGLPFLLSRKSVIPVFFGLYSTKAFIFIIIYNITLIITLAFLVTSYLIKDYKVKKTDSQSSTEEKPAKSDNPIQ